MDLTWDIVSVFFKMSMKKRVQLLKSYLVKKFPELNDYVGFLSSSKNQICTNWSWFTTLFNKELIS